jgi:hypothetical protein
MTLVNKNSGSIEPTPEPTPEPSIVHWTQLLLAIAAILTATSQVINALPFHH